MIKEKEKLTAAWQLSDWDIIQKILEGEKYLLEILYNRYATKVFHKCLSITKDRDISKDLSHDIIIKIFLNLVKFKGTADFSFWVYSITYNHCMDYLKKKKRIHFDDLASKSSTQISTDEIELEHKVLKELRLNQLELLFEELKADEKIILLMRYQDGMSVKEIATTLKVGESAIKMRLKRSRDRLAELIKDTEYET
jgi:RNA polymerase sigma-70 factor (ECF subfamily)